MTTMVTLKMLEQFNPSRGNLADFLATLAVVARRVPASGRFGDGKIFAAALFDVFHDPHGATWTFELFAGDWGVLGVVECFECGATWLVGEDNVYLSAVRS